MLAHCSTSVKGIASSKMNLKQNEAQSARAELTHKGVNPRIFSNMVCPRKVGKYKRPNRIQDDDFFDKKKKKFISL